MDYFFISAEFFVYGRCAQINYGNSEDHGTKMGHGHTLADAINIAEYLNNSYRCKYGVRISEKIDLKELDEDTSEEGSIKEPEPF